ncbi:unnamed protein product [Amoebophrya sp. A25]|nr:unnamed protein product [Amoebophrya sp. A25]|eukprot:GSA25T00002675001.1
MKKLSKKGSKKACGAGMKKAPAPGGSQASSAKKKATTSSTTKGRKSTKKVTSKGKKSSTSKASFFDDDEDSIDEGDGVFDEADERKYGETIDTIFERQGLDKRGKKVSSGSSSSQKKKKGSAGSDDDDAFFGGSDDDEDGPTDLLSLMESMTSKQDKKQATASASEQEKLVRDVEAVTGTRKTGDAAAATTNRLANVDESMTHLIEDSDHVNLADLLRPLREDTTSACAVGGAEDLDSAETTTKTTTTKTSTGQVQRQLQQLEEAVEKLENQEPVLGEVKQARKEREMNYEQTKKDVRRWDAQVKANKDGRQLLFGDYEDLLENRSTKSLAAAFRFQTASNSLAGSKVDSFEAEIAQALRETKQEVEGQKQAEAAIDLDGTSQQIREAKRAQQMAQLRALQVRELTRAKRLKKIKSKSFHRVKKRIDNKEREKILSRLEQEDPELAANLKREMEEKMAQVRSRRGADARKKWARMANRFGGKEMQSVISTQAQKAEDDKRALQRALKAKEGRIGRGGNGDDSDSDLDLSDEELDPLEKAEMLAKKELHATKNPLEETGSGSKGLFGMKFMQEAMAKKREGAAKQAEDLLQEIGSWRKKAGMKKGSDDEGQSGDEDAEETRNRRDDDDTSDEGSDSEGSVDNEDHAKPAFSKEDIEAAEKALGSGAVEDDLVPEQEEMKDSVIVGASAATSSSSSPQGDEGAISRKRKAADQEEQPGLSNTAQASSIKSTKRKKKENKSKTTTSSGVVAPYLRPQQKSNEGTDSEFDGNDSEDSENADSSDDEGDQHDPFAAVDAADESNAELIRSSFAAFSGDAQADFDAEINDGLQKKQDKIDAEANKMTGWGSWAGLGVEPRRKPKEQHNANKNQSEFKPKQVTTTLFQQSKRPSASSTPGAVPSPVSSAKVTLLDDGAPAAAWREKYQVQNVPYPFQSREQYETAMGRPMGQEWNTGAMHKRKIQPQVVTRLGAVVQPLQFIKHASTAEERDVMLDGWKKNHKPKKPKARF